MLRVVTHPSEPGDTEFPDAFDILWDARFSRREIIFLDATSVAASANFNANFERSHVFPIGEAADDSPLPHLLWLERLNVRLRTNK